MQSIKSKLKFIIPTTVIGCYLSLRMGVFGKELVLLTDDCGEHHSITHHNIENTDVYFYNKTWRFSAMFYR